MPDVKHLVRVIPGETSYAEFPQGEDYKLVAGLKTKDLWGQHVKPLDRIPIAKVLDLATTSMMPEKMNIGYGYFLTDKTPLVFTANDKFNIGDQYFSNNKNELRIIINSEKLPDSSFKYTYYEFTKILHLPVAGCLGRGLLYNIILNEMDDMDDGYQRRFSPLVEKLESLGVQISAVTQYINDNKEGLGRIYKDVEKLGELSLPRQERKDDIAELIIQIKKNFELIRIYFPEAKKVLQEYMVFRRELLTEKFFALFTNKNSEEECNHTFGEICHAIQQMDRDKISYIGELIEKTTYHIDSINALTPPSSRASSDRKGPFYKALGRLGEILVVFSDHLDIMASNYYYMQGV